MGLRLKRYVVAKRQVRGRWQELLSANQRRRLRVNGVESTNENQAENHRQAAPAIVQTEGRITMNLMS